MPSASENEKERKVSVDENAEVANKGIEKMYKIYEKLNSAKDKTMLESDFKELLEAVKRSDKEKRLASQFITRFLEFFPLLYDDAINAMLDLCEDDDVAIRKQVCKDLVTVCKKVNTFVPKISDVFSQLLQTDDTMEQKGLESCLVSLFHIDSQAAVVGIFSQIANGEEVVRERCFKFLNSKLKELSPEIVNNDFERCLLSEARKCASDLSGDDFKQLHTLLMKTKIIETPIGQQTVVDMIGQMLDMEKDFNPSEAENFDKLILCSKYSLTSLAAFSSKVNPTAFLVYYCTKVLPALENMPEIENGVNLKLEALRMMADMAFHVSTLDSKVASKCIDPVYKAIVDLMPHPPLEDEINPKFEFSLIETLLYTLHKLGSFYPDFFVTDSDHLKDFRSRLQYLARGSSAYMKKLREDLQGKRGPELRSDENRSKIQALKLTSNISAVVKDFFHTPPNYKAVVGLSWRPVPRASSPQKRSSTDNSTAVMAKQQARGENRALYQPPSGKFSNRAGSYANSSKGRGNGGGGGGGFRGGRRGGGGRGGRY